MAVALKRQEFDPLEVEELSLLYPGMLTGVFADSATNAATFGSLTLVHNADDLKTVPPTINAAGHILDTPDRLARFYVEEHPFEAARHLDEVTFGYSIAELEKPSPKDNAISTDIGRMAMVAHTDVQNQMEQARQKEEQNFMFLLRTIHKDNESLRELLERIAEIDKKLEAIEKERQELFALEAACEMGATPEERRQNKLNLATRLGLSRDRFTDANGNINDTALSQAIREELKTRREQLAQEERELRARREDLVEQYEAIQKNQTAYRTKATEELTQSLGLPPEKASAVKADPALLLEMVSVQNAQLAPATAKAENSSARDMTAMLEESETEETPQARINALENLEKEAANLGISDKPMTILDAKARAGSAAMSLDGDTPSTSVITAKFQKASNPDTSSDEMLQTASMAASLDNTSNTLRAVRLGG